MNDSLARVLLIGALVITGLACGDPADEEPIDEVPPRPAYREWLKVEPPGAVCGNGSQYKFFVNFSDVSNSVVVYMEPGGGCWDFASCTGRDPLGAANINGIPDDHYSFGEIIAPMFKRDREDNLMRDWNYVFVPYCTGDVHTGNNVATYSDPDGVEPDVEFHHRGHDNTQAVIAWMAEEFPDIPRLLLTGCSAGGAGALVNYYYFRKQLPQIERGYLLSDSGPIFPGGGHSRELHTTVRASWNLDSLLNQLPLAFDRNDFGSINSLISIEFPRDRLAVSMFRRDYNYSRYSYERFFGPDKEDILERWWEDIERLTTLYDSFGNLSYYIPYWRSLNDSHCTTVITYQGSDIEEEDMTMHRFIEDLLDDDAPLQSYLESVQPDEDVP